jgi:hypothetical protein
LNTFELIENHTVSFGSAQATDPRPPNSGPRDSLACTHTARPGAVVAGSCRRPRTPVLGYNRTRPPALFLSRGYTSCRAPGSFSFPSPPLCSDLVVVECSTPLLYARYLHSPPSDRTVWPIPSTKGCRPPPDLHRRAITIPPTSENHHFWTPLRFELPLTFPSTARSCRSAPSHRWPSQKLSPFKHHCSIRFLPPHHRATTPVRTLPYHHARCALRGSLTLTPPVAHLQSHCVAAAPAPGAVFPRLRV